MSELKEVLDTFIMQDRTVMNTEFDDLLPLLPLPPPSPSQTSHLPHSILVDLDNSATNYTSSAECMTKEVSALTLGREAYKIVHDKCHKLHLSSKSCFLSFYQPTHPIIQSGPVCGIVALAMAAPLLGKPHVKTEHLYNRSIELHLSKQGELFSVDYMKVLTQDTLKCGVEVAHTTEDEHKKKIVNWLLQGAVLLIPYDSDKNYYPCLKKGHKAHWAVITGFFLALNSQAESSVYSHCREDSEKSNLYHCSEPTFLLELQNSVQYVSVYGQQGKSKYPGIWNLDDLLASNMNLKELDPSRAAEADRYVIPHGGIEGGLCGRIVVLTVD